MSRLTITLTESRYRALKAAAAQRDRTIGQLIEDSLEFYGIKPHDEARALVSRARQRAGLDDTSAIALANAQTRAARAVAPE